MADDSDSSIGSLSSMDSDKMEEIVAPKPTKATPQKKKKKKNGTILSFFKNKSPTPPRKKRPASPPHEMVPEDNPDIAFIVMFRSRFQDAFPPKTPHFGPQDIERGVAEGLPTAQIETLLCALLAMLLNRKKPIEKGHYGRALEEAISQHKSSWPKEWLGQNPIRGDRSFNSMTSTERLTLLRTLVLWSLHDSEVVNGMIKEGYKSRTTKDKADTNIPLSVQPWGRDGDNRRYWLIEGQDDTSFRVYRESNPKLKNINWWSVAGDIDQIRVLAQKLVDDDGTREAKSLSERMLNAIPRFEATAEKRKRREYRLGRQAAFSRPEPGFSLYEGRTRGKRMKYTFSDEEEEYSDALGIRRSNRNSARQTPAVPAGPTVTASGRQVRSRATGMYGESLLSGQTPDAPSPGTGDYAGSEEDEQAGENRATRGGNRSTNGWAKGDRKHIETYNSVDEMDDEDDATSWDGGDEDEDEHDQMELDDDEDDLAENSSEDDERKSLVVRLRYSKGAFNPSDKQGSYQQPSQAQAVPVQPKPPGTLPFGSPSPAATQNSAPTPKQEAPIPPTQSVLPQQFASSPVQPIHNATPPSVVHPQQERPTLPPIAQGFPPPHVVQLPRVEPQSHFSVPAPTPPYVSPEQPKPQYQTPPTQAQPHPSFQPTPLAQVSHAGSTLPYQPTAPPPAAPTTGTNGDSHPPYQSSTLSQPTPASSWQ